MHPERCQGKTGNPYSTLELLTSQSERLLPIAVLSVAAFLRLYDLATIPGGLLTDEAFNGLDALRIIDGDRPIFLVENNGREPLFIYLQAISIAFLGQSALSLRVVSAILGIMTVVVSYFLAKRMFGFRVALLATGWLAISLWHVIFSRIAWRTISLPLIVALGIYCLWRGLEEVKTQARVGSASPILSPRSALWFALGGVMIGLSLYTYSIARFAPFVVVGLALYLALLHRNLFPIAFPGFLLALTLTILVFLPQGLFFAHHPDSFVERAREVTIVNPDLHGGNPGQAILNSAFRTLGMFFIKGRCWRGQEHSRSPHIRSRFSATDVVRHRDRRPAISAAGIRLPHHLAGRNVCTQFPGSQRHTKLSPYHRTDPRAVRVARIRSRLALGSVGVAPVYPPRPHAAVFFVRYHCCL